MKISTILAHIDSGHMALPEFQRGYVWNREQVRGLFDSLYRRHPVGGLLVWATESHTAAHRGDGPLVPGIVKLLLDGQQRMTSLYGVVRGVPPKFFDGNAQAFTSLRFHLATETFAFYQPIKMQGDSLWVDVTQLMQSGSSGLGGFIASFATDPKIGDYVNRLGRLLGILDIELHIEEVAGSDKTLEIVVDIFNRVNSGGTKLSKGDLALAKICAEWPDARDEMKAKLKEWSGQGYNFNLDWLLRSVNTVLTGEAKFSYLHDKSAIQVQDGLKRSIKHLDTSLNLIAGRLGLDHDQVLFSRFALPVMVRYLDQCQSQLSEVERDKLLFWFAQTGMWGRFSGNTETVIDKDIGCLDGPGGGLDKLLAELRLWRGGLRVEPGHFTGWSLGARFYPVLYMLTRTTGARDWGLGIELKANLLGNMSRLEVHHIFPKAQLYMHGYKRAEVNALANFCFLTKNTNLNISDTLPEIYFPMVEAKHPGALASQWIPQDPQLWRIDKYTEFLEARKALLAEAANGLFASLLHGDGQWLQARAPANTSPVLAVSGGIASEQEEAELEAINDWVAEQGLPRGVLSFELSHCDTGDQVAVIDLAWPSGVQEELSSPVALMLNESGETLALASEAGFRCFTNVASLKHYIQQDILALESVV